MTRCSAAASGRGRLGWEGRWPGVGAGVRVGAGRAKSAAAHLWLHRWAQIECRRQLHALLSHSACNVLAQPHACWFHAWPPPVEPRPAPLLLPLPPPAQVTQSKLWAAVGRHFNPPKSMTNLSFHVKKLYERVLLAYERVSWALNWL